MHQITYTGPGKKRRRFMSGSRISNTWNLMKNVGERKRGWDQFVGLRLIDSCQYPVSMPIPSLFSQKRCK